MDEQKPTPTPEEQPKTGTGTIQANISAMLLNPTIARFYANGFVGGRTQTDIFAISMMNGNPQFIVNMSFSTAKNLHKFLDNAIKDIEKVLEQEIKSLPIPIKQVQ